jgi:hypothetical protein
MMRTKKLEILNLKQIVQVNEHGEQTGLQTSSTYAASLIDCRGDQKMAQ